MTTDGIGRRIRPDVSSTASLAFGLRGQSMFPWLPPVLPADARPLGGMIGQYAFASLIAADGAMAH